MTRRHEERICQGHEGKPNTVFLGLSHFGMPLDAGILLAVASLFVGLGAWSFSRIQA